eukprot:m.202094 g.202094  ORF g.202094 m.202094 type:complete len:84 (+) comp15748_c1_seq22:2260-2511(+)
MHHATTERCYVVYYVPVSCGHGQCKPNMHTHLAHIEVVNITKIKRHLQNMQQTLAEAYDSESAPTSTLCVGREHNMAVVPLLL